jgi:imidazolonepropionase-like amidohydrolase
VERKIKISVLPWGESYLKTSLVSRLILIVMLCLVSATTVRGNSKKVPDRGCTAFAHVTVVDPSSKGLQEDVTVVVCGERIRSVKGTPRAQVPKRTRVVDARGKFLIPGLWDFHVHLAQAGQASGPLFLAYGVTSVRDCGSTFAVLRDWREKVAAGTLAGPRIKGPGAVFESPHFLQAVTKIEGMLEPGLAESLRAAMQGRIGLTSPTEAQAQVDMLKAQGADFIKVRNANSPEILYAIAEASKRDGLSLAGHVIRGVDLAKASDAGQHSIEHDEDYFGSNPAPVTATQQAELEAQFVRNGTVLVPTIVTERARLAPEGQIQAVLDDTAGATNPLRRFLSPDLLNFWRMQEALKKYDSRPESWQSTLQKGKDLVRAMREAGVQILPGTDLGVPLLYPGASLLDELQIFVDDIGMSPRDALESATVLPARWFRIQNEIGTVAQGKLADLVLLDANPLENIQNLRKVSGVVANGRYYDRTKLGACSSNCRNLKASSREGFVRRVGHAQR